MKYLVPALLSVALLAGFNQQASSAEDLICQIAAKDDQSCTPVLSLKSGNLTLKAEDLSFELIAQYEACFQKEAVKITGQYQQRANDKTHDIELLAKQVVTVDEEEKTSTFPQTIGLVSLDIDSKKGHFTDIRAIILAYGKPIEALDKADVNCKVNP